MNLDKVRIPSIRLLRLKLQNARMSVGHPSTFSDVICVVTAHEFLSIVLPALESGVEVLKVKPALGKKQLESTNISEPTCIARLESLGLAVCVVLSPGHVACHGVNLAHNLLSSFLAVGLMQLQRQPKLATNDAQGV